MRIDRQKRVTKDLRRYKMAFNIQGEPWRVVLDPTFISVALDSKVDIKTQLCKMLNNTKKLTPIVTTCGIRELEKLENKVGSRFKGALMIAKGFYHLKCGHNSDESSNSNSKCSVSTCKSAADCIARIFTECPEDVDPNALQINSSNITNSYNTGTVDDPHWGDWTIADAAKQLGDENDAKKSEDASKNSIKKPGPKKSDSGLKKENLNKTGTAETPKTATLNHRKWLVATQDESLKKTLRQIPGVPILTLNGQCPRLEPMSKSSNTYWKTKECDKVDKNQSISEVLKRESGVKVLKREIERAKREKRMDEMLKKSKGIVEGEYDVDRKKKKKQNQMKQANPLSCKKKQKVMNKGSGGKQQSVSQQVNTSVIKSGDQDNGKKAKKTRSRRGKQNNADGNAVVTSVSATSDAMDTS